MRQETKDRIKMIVATALDEIFDVMDAEPFSEISDQLKETAKNLEAIDGFTQARIYKYGAVGPLDAAKQMEGTLFEEVAVEKIPLPFGQKEIGGSIFYTYDPTRLKLLEEMVPEEDILPLYEQSLLWAKEKKLTTPYDESLYLRLATAFAGMSGSSDVEAELDHCVKLVEFKYKKDLFSKT